MILLISSLETYVVGKVILMSTFYGDLSNEYPRHVFMEN